MDFQASTGDVWNIDIYNLYNDTICGIETRIVDSIGTDITNGITIRWVAYSSDNDNIHVKAYERFMPINNFLFPHLYVCIDVLQEVELKILRCYSDNELGEIVSESELITSPEIPCELYETVSNSELIKTNDIKIYPNPCKQNITIVNSNSAVVKCIVCNNLGKEIDNIRLNGLENEIMLNISYVVYFVKFLDKRNNMISSQRIIIHN